MREQPNSPPEIMPQAVSTITQVREYELITPLFGGGVKPGEADAVTVVRATEIRGHLRFWWRACRGGRNKSIAEMKKGEDAIWGKAHTKEEDGVAQEQTVQIVVEVLKRGNPIKPYRMEGRRAKSYNNIPGYAAFPLQPTEEESRNPNLVIRDVQENVSFKMTIAFPSEGKDDIEAALWAWETFGGIGARTRRGFGALHLLRVNGMSNGDIPVASNVKAWIDDKLSTYIVEGGVPNGVPHLQRTSFLHVSRSFTGPMVAWERLIRTLYNFRQAGRPSRTVWPEADAIRARNESKDQRGNAQSQVIDKFPKAVLGLPIIYHFINNEPKERTLQGAEAGRERLASPFILRPLLCKNNQAVGLALLLEGPRLPPDGVVLIEKGNKNDKPKSVNVALTAKEAQRIDVLNGEPDVLKAFMKYLERTIR